MSKDIIVYIHCPEIMECPMHSNESQVVDGILRDICDILKYSFIIGENRALSYFGRKIDLDYKVIKNDNSINTDLKYSFMLNGRLVNCVCNLTNLLGKLACEKVFVDAYTNLIKAIIKDIGKKTIECLKNNSVPIQIKFADLKKHYNK